MRRLRHALTVVLLVAAVSGGLCLLDDHTGAADFCLMLLGVTVMATAPVALIVAQAKIVKAAAGWPRSFPHQTRPAPI
jgi:hypothetical protein